MVPPNGALVAVQLITACCWVTVTVVWPATDWSTEAPAVPALIVPWKLCAAAGDGPTTRATAMASVDTRLGTIRLRMTNLLRENPAGQRDQHPDIPLAIVESRMFQRHGDGAVETETVGELGAKTASRRFQMVGAFAVILVPRPGGIAEN